MTTAMISPSCSIFGPCSGVIEMAVPPLPNCGFSTLPVMSASVITVTTPGTLRAASTSSDFSVPRAIVLVTRTP
jgi:hypothetical protein